MTRVSIHLCCFNRPEHLTLLLSSLLRQSHKEWDLIIADDSPRQLIDHQLVSALLQKIQMEDHAVIYDYTPLRAGVVAARNRCIKRDTLNDLCVRIDDDSWCEPDYLERLVTTYELLGKDGAKIGAVGGLVPVFAAPKIERNIEKIKTFNAIRIKGDSLEVADDGGTHWSGKTPYHASAHLRSSFLFSKKAAIEIGLFPEEYGITSAFREETDFCMRLKIAGYSLYTDLGAIAWHLQATVGGLRNQFYAESVAQNDEHFKRKFLRLKKQGKIKPGMFEVVE